MKNKFKYVVFALFCAFSMISCDPQEDKHYALGDLDTVTAEQVSFTYAVSATNSKQVTFTNTSQVSVPYSLMWDFGNGKQNKGQSVVNTYTANGQYTVSLTLYTADGTSVSKSTNITIQ